VIKRDMQICAEPTLGRTDVISRSGEVPRNNRLLLRQGVNGVGELNLTVHPMGCLLQALKDFWAEDVAAYNGEI
jgi:hypothetical protein